MKTKEQAAEEYADKVCKQYGRIHDEFHFAKLAEQDFLAGYSKAESELLQEIEQLKEKARWRDVAQSGRGIRSEAAELPKVRAKILIKTDTKCT